MLERYLYRKDEVVKDVDELDDMLSDELNSSNSVSSSSDDSDLDLDDDLMKPPSSDNKQYVLHTSEQSIGIAHATTAIDFD